MRDAPAATAVMTSRTAPESAADARRAKIYEQNRGYVLLVLRRRCGWLVEADYEGLYHDAFLLLLDKEQQGLVDVTSMNAHQVRAYLAQTALNKALDERKRAGRKRSVSLANDDIYADARSEVAEELVDGADERARVREIVDDLPARQQSIVKLRFFFERTPTEIQEYLGISERAYRRDFERAMRTIADGFELLRNDAFCDSRRSLILAFVAGIAGPGRMADARRHLATCRACAAWAAELRTAGERVAAAAPMPVLLGGDVGGRLGGLGDRVMSVVETVKSHAMGLALRGEAAAPAQFAGARPGAAAAAIAGCLAVGGGATYCAVEGLPLPRALTHQQQPAAKGEREQARKPATQRRAPAAATAPTRPASSSPTATTPSTATAKAPAPTAAQRAAARRTAAKKAAVAKVKRAQRKNAELTFEGSGSTAPPSGTGEATAASTGGQTSTGTSSGGATSGGSSSTSTSSSSSGGGGSGAWSGEFAP